MSDVALEYLVWRFNNLECAPNYLFTYITLKGDLHIDNDSIIKSAIKQNRLDSVKYIFDNTPIEYWTDSILYELIDLAVECDSYDIVTFLNPIIKIENVSN